MVPTLVFIKRISFFKVLNTKNSGPRHMGISSVLRITSSEVYSLLHRGCLSSSIDIIEKLLCAKHYSYWGFNNAMSVLHLGDGAVLWEWGVGGSTRSSGAESRCKVDFLGGHFGNPMGPCMRKGPMLGVSCFTVIILKFLIIINKLAFCTQVL